MKFVSDLRQVGDFFRILRFPLPIKLTVRFADIGENVYHRFNLVFHNRSNRGLAHMVVRFNTIYAIITYPHSIQHSLIKFVSDLREGQWFSSDIPASSINKTDRHDIAEILLKVALNTINK